MVRQVLPKKEISPYTVANSFIGLKEVPGHLNNPLIMDMLKLDNSWPQSDEVPWCSAFVNYVMHLCGLPRSRSLAARSWAQMTYPSIPILKASRGWDIVILNRGGSFDYNKSGPAHVGFFSELVESKVIILGGNQMNTVKLSTYPTTSILKIIRIGAI